MKMSEDSEIISLNPFICWLKNWTLLYLCLNDSSGALGIYIYLQISNPYSVCVGLLMDISASGSKQIEKVKIFHCDNLE